MNRLLESKWLMNFETGRISAYNMAPIFYVYHVISCRECQKKVDKMLRGTRVLIGEEANHYDDVIEYLKRAAKHAGFTQVILPSVWEAETFAQKVGAEKAEQMWRFRDKGDRDVCLVPEMTGMIQELWNDGWSKSMPKPTKLFYVGRCYRYDRPQKGRYREFTQFGIEILGGKAPEDREEALLLLNRCLASILGGKGVEYAVVDEVKRGIHYYVEDGFEAECPILGAQKQIAGGGRYAEGIGWAVGVDRLLLAQEMTLALG
jgi:histidyl-tRNA synthetase